MDIDTLTLLGETISAWCRDNAPLINDLEHASNEDKLIRRVFTELDAMGILNVLGDPDTHDELHAVAEIAYHLGRYSPSLAVMAVQQNLACWLFAEAGNPAPQGWIALPLFDAIPEWRSQSLKTVSGIEGSLDGCWQGIPMLPVAERIMLPLMPRGTSPFMLVALPLHDQTISGIKVSPPIVTLGLRGCPQADLHFNHARLPDDSVLMSGQKAFSKLEALWSQAEICMMALRAGIAESSYLTARDYATQRYQGGKIIIRHSLIRKMLSDLYREKCVIDDLWRSMASHLRPGVRLSHGQMGTALNSGEKLPWLTSDGIQILGGVGYMEEYAQERRYRDAKQCEFLLGHPQVRNFSLWQTEVE
jgi:alkylation response protein AidB-like acyl-CoA dehydrogenase